MSNNEIFDKVPTSINYQRIHPKYLPVVVPGGGNLASVLSTGPNPGSAGCQPMIDVFGIGGCPTVDLQITSVGPNADLILENNNAGDGVIVNAGTTIQLNTDQFASGANTSVQISAGQVDIQPNPTYPYGANPDVPLKISNYNNLTGFVQAGVLVGPNTAQGEIQGFTVDTLQSGPGSNAFGLKIDNVNGDTTSYGIRSANILANVGDAYGCELSGILGSANAYGLNVNSLTSNNAGYGVNVNGITDTVNEANGVFAGSITAPNTSRGGYFQKIQCPTGSAIGMEADDVQGDSVVGSFIHRLQSQTGGCIGVLIDDVKSASNNQAGLQIQAVGDTSGSLTARGMSINNVQQDPTAVGSQAYGAEILNTTAETAFGCYIDATSGQRTTGLRVGNTTATSSTARGIDIINTTSPREVRGVSIISSKGTGTLNAYGLHISGTECVGNLASAYGAFLTRAGGKAITDNGLLLRLRDGNMGFGLQAPTVANPNIFNDAGNLVVIEPALAGGTVTLQAPTLGWEQGQFYLIQKQGAGLNIADSAGTLFNGGAGPYAFGGPAYNMLILFYAVGQWCAHVL